MAIEEPAYEILNAAPPFEVRRYPPLTVAQISVPEDDRAQSRAFRTLAGFIFGANRATSKIAMTSPVTVERGAKIAMTAPVTTHAAGGELTMRFVMPSAYTLATLPAPNDRAISIVELPAETVAAVSFSGLWTGRNIRIEESRLRAWAVRENIAVRGPARTAFYNSPFSVPWMRKNEIWLSVAA